MMVVKGDVNEAAGSLQLCAGQESGSEAAIHAIHDIFEDSETEAVLLVDAANAFNSINRAAMLRNIGVICPAIATYVTNCYFHPVRLFVIGGIEIRSLEGTTQGDPTAMATYALGLTPLLEELLHFELLHTVKLVAFAGDLTGAGKLQSLKQWWEKLAEIGPKYGYYPQSKKSYVIVKNEHLSAANTIFYNLNIKITSYLGNDILVR